MEKKLKKWQGWLLFGGSMVIVFVLGLDRLLPDGEKS
jgi:nitrite reductase (cytochrome c-552)